MINRVEDNTSELARLAINTMLYQYPSIIESTSKRQKKNGTIQFTLKNGEEFTIHTTGYVRKRRKDRFGNYTCYQLNRVKTIKSTYQRLNPDGKTFRDVECDSYARIMIPTAVERVWYLKDYLEKNRTKDIKDI